MAGRGDKGSGLCTAVPGWTGPAPSRGHDELRQDELRQDEVLGRWRELAQLSKKAGAWRHTPALMIPAPFGYAPPSVDRFVLSFFFLRPSSSDRLPSHRSW